MCFELYAGTKSPLPEISFNPASPNVNVEPLSELQAAIRNHFKSPVVQYIGSSSNCGCDFPHAMFQNGGWPEIDDRDERLDAERLAIEHQNRQSLVDLLRKSGEDVVKFYGIWDGEFTEPLARERILVDRILDADFVFKEGGFYEVQIQRK